MCSSMAWNDFSGTIFIRPPWSWPDEIVVLRPEASVCAAGTLRRSEPFRRRWSSAARRRSRSERSEAGASRPTASDGREGAESGGVVPTDHELVDLLDQVWASVADLGRGVSEPEWK